MAPFSKRSALLLILSIIYTSSCHLKRDGAALIAAFSFVDGCSAPCDVQFTNLSTNAVEFTWDFGDNSTADIHEVSPSHNYALPGDYSVKLTAIDENGNSSMVIHNIKVGTSTFELDFQNIGEPLAEGKCGRQMTDGNFVITGWAISNNGLRYNMVRLRISWKGDSIRYAPISNSGIDSKGYWVEETSTGDYVFAGSREDNSSNITRAYIHQSGENFNIPLISNFVPSINKDQAYFIQETSDHGFILAGETKSYGNQSGNSNILVLKTASNISVFDNSFDTDGILAIGGANTDIGYCVRQTSSDELTVCGYSKSNAGDENMRVIKLSSTGATIWDSTYQRSGDQILRSIRPLSNGGFIAIGYTKDFKSNGEKDVFLVKILDNGKIDWYKNFGGVFDDIGNDIEIINGGSDGFVIVGSTKSYTNGGSDVYLIKTDAQGNDLWAANPRHFGRVYDDAGNSIDLTEDGGLFITGFGSISANSPDKKIYVIKTNYDGKL